MKSTINFGSKLGFLILVIFVSSNLNAATYTTLNNGAWNDVTNVWSLDGVTPCGCTPGAMSSGNDIIINHSITMSYNTVFNAGSNIFIAPGADLSGPFNIDIFNANMDAWGNISIAKYLQVVNTNVTLHPGCIMTLTNKFNAMDGTFTMDGALIYMSSGNFQVDVTGTFNVTNGSRVNIANGNIVVEGMVFLESGSCMTSKGNWKNFATGTVMGGGSATTEVGNMQNDGIWDVAITWCSAGTDFGLPSPEDCATATSVCNGISLPVELVDFTAEYMGDVVVVSWSTLSEVNNDRFIVLHSNNGKDWFTVGEVKGMGTTTETQNYELEHDEMVSGVNYYQLVQIDMDGREFYSDVVSVNIRSNEEELLVYPNPASSSSTITIKNVGEDSGIINILNTSGRSVAQTEIHPWTDNVQMQIPQLSPGIYIITVEQSGKIRTKKLIVK